MTLKRVLYLFISLTTLLVIVIAAVSTRGSHSISMTKPRQLDEMRNASASVPAEASSADPGWFGAFILDYEAKHGETSDEVMTQLLYSTNSVCGDLVAGNSVPDVWQMLVDHGQSSDQAATVIDLAVKYYCPQYSNKLDREAGEIN